MYAIKKKTMVSSERRSETRIMEAARKGADFLAKHQKKMVLAAAALAAIIVFAAAYSLYSSGAEKRAAGDLAAALSAYEGTDGVSADYARALELFKAVQAKYPRTTSGAVARYYAGNSLAQMDRHREALSEYEAFVKQYPGEKELLGLVYQRMGYSRQSLGSRDEAFAAFTQAEKILGPGIASLELARLHEAAGNQAEARKQYELIAGKLKGTSLAAEAASKLPSTDASAPPTGQSAEKTGK